MFLENAWRCYCKSQENLFVVCLTWEKLLLNVAIKMKLLKTMEDKNLCNKNSIMQIRNILYLGGTQSWLGYSVSRYYYFKSNMTQTILYAQNMPCLVDLYIFHAPIINSKGEQLSTGLTSPYKEYMNINGRKSFFCCISCWKEILSFELKKFCSSD